MLPNKTKKVYIIIILSQSTLNHSRRYHSALMLDFIVNNARAPSFGSAYPSHYLHVNKTA